METGNPEIRSNTHRPNLVKNASDANGREKDDFENDGGQKLDEEWVV